MRYKLTHNGQQVIESDYLDLVQGAATAVPGAVLVIDNWTGKVVEPVITATNVKDHGPGTSYTYDPAPKRLPVMHIDELCATGHKIRAVKLVREMTDLGLGEAKAVVEGIVAAEDRRRRTLDNDPGNR